jgi:PAS domain S-box-containing protein
MTDFRAQALKAAEIGIIDDDPANEALYWSPTLYEILGVSADLTPSHAAYLDLTHPADREAVRQAFCGAAQRLEDRIITIEHRVLRASGETRWLSARVQVAVPAAGSGQSARVVCSVTDITGRKEKEEEARHNEARLSAILSIAPNAIISIDAGQRITLFNEAAEKLFGYGRDELLGQPLNVLLPLRYRSMHGQHIERFWSSRGNARRMGERQNVAGLRKDGSEFPAEASISKIEVGGEKIYTVVLQDITERKIAAEQLAEMNRILEKRVAERTHELEIEMKRREDAQKQLIQSQRMEAFGQLTGGIAHDFNNLLAIVTGSLELLEPDVKSPAARKHLERANNAAEMGGRLTSRLLTFARRRRLEPTLLNLNEQVTNLLELLQRTLGEQIVLRTSLASDPWLTRADPSEAENALLNLALNARDAMPNGGRLYIGTANITVDESQAGELRGLQPGDFVRLSLTDTGLGMAPNVLQRVFEPFFTTKGTGRGSGLGLSTLYGFASQSGGTVTIYSELGRGTTVHLYLPRAESGTEGDRLPASRIAKILFSRNNETVLVVEDNPEVRETTLERIEGLGYVVTEAANGPDAIGVLNSDPGIALVFSDIVMPGGMSGYDLGQWVKDHKPDVKVVLASGFAAELTDMVREGQFQVLRKPFNRAELAGTLSNALYGTEEN